MFFAPCTLALQLPAHLGVELANASCIMVPFPIGVAIASKVGPVVDESVRENQFVWSVVEAIQSGRMEDIGQLHCMTCSGRCTVLVLVLVNSAPLLVCHAESCNSTA